MTSTSLMALVNAAVKTL